MVWVDQCGEFFRVLQDFCQSRMIRSNGNLLLILIMTTLLIFSKLKLHFLSVEHLLERGYIRHVLIWERYILVCYFLNVLITYMHIFGWVFVENIHDSPLVSRRSILGMLENVLHQIKTIFEILQLIIRWYKRFKCVNNSFLFFQYTSSLNVLIIANWWKIWAYCAYTLLFLHYRVRP